MKTVYVDDCCKLRNKIKSIFGPHVSVKLDLFHAVQRITKTIPKKHMHASQCLKELSIVFRSDGDCGDKRLFPTPSAEKLLDNLDKFMTKWQQNDHEKATVFKPETVSALQRLRQHMQLGCLSNIPVGAGTNRNERLHQHLGSYFNRSKIGVLLAYALLNVILHSHNASTRVSGKQVSRPISASPFRAAQTAVQSVTVKPMGIIPKQQSNKLNIDHWEADTSETTFTVDYGLVIPVFQRSLQKLYIVNGLMKLNITELAKNIYNFQEFCTSDICFSNDINQFESLMEYGLTISPSNTDGNCFFQSIAINICTNPSAWSHLHVVGKCTPEISDMTAKLRQIFVDEILGNHRSMYEHFVQPIEDFTAESKRFLQDGFYNNSVGDLMPVAMATALLTNIVIFSTNQDSHPMYVVPMAGSPNGIIFLVYHPAGTGHYDAAIPCSYAATKPRSTSTDSETLHVKTSCSCGVNTTKSNTSCAPNPTYAT